MLRLRISFEFNLGEALRGQRFKRPGCRLVSTSALLLNQSGNEVRISRRHSDRRICV